MANQARLIHSGVSTDYATLFTNNPAAPGAIDDAVTGDTIEVLDDISFASVGTLGQKSSIYIYDKGITLDLDGHTLTFTAAQDTDSATAIEIKSSSSIINETTIKNGTIHTENGCNGIYIDSNSKVTLEDLVVDQNGTGGQSFWQYAAVTGAPSANTSTVIINSGTYSAENIAIALGDHFNAEINGGTFYSKNVTGPITSTAAVSRSSYCKALNSYVAKTTINGGTFGQGRENEIAIGADVQTANDLTINGGTFNGKVLDITNNALVNDGTFNDNIVFDSDVTGRYKDKYQLEGGSFVDDKATVESFVTNTNKFVNQVGPRCYVVDKPNQPEDEYKYLSGKGLATLWELIKQRVAVHEGDAVKITEDATGGHTFDVLHDGKTIITNSEGKLEATFQKSEGVKPVIVDSEGVIKLLYDNKTITLDSESNINIPIDNITIVISSEGKMVATPEPLQEGKATKPRYDGRKEVVDVVIDNKTIRYNDNSEGLYLPIDEITIVIDSEGKLTAVPEPLKSGEAIDVHYEGRDEVVNVLYDDKAVVLDSEGKLTIPLDNVTIIINSEGEIETVTDKLQDGIATKVVYTNRTGQVDVQYDDKSIVLDSEGRLIANIDGNTIVFDSEGYVAITPILVSKIEAMWNSLI